MLSRAYRLTHKDVECVLRCGVRYRGVGVSLTTHTHGAGPTRFAVVVPKKYTKHAADRNRLRRSVYRYLRQKQTEIHEGHDAIFFIQKPYNKISLSDLECTIQKLLQEAKLITP